MKFLCCRQVLCLWINWWRRCLVSFVLKSRNFSLLCIIYFKKNASDILSSIPPMLFMCVSMQIKLFLFFFITITSSLSFSSSSSRISVIFFLAVICFTKTKIQKKKKKNPTSYFVWSFLSCRLATPFLSSTFLPCHFIFPHFILFF